jgi:hypothetical protein
MHFAGSDDLLAGCIGPSRQERAQDDNADSAEVAE